jgi:hypothetical protein
MRDDRGVRNIKEKLIYYVAAHLQRVRALDGNEALKRSTLIVTMSQRSDYDAIRVEIEADLAAGRRPVFTEVARRTGCHRTTVSRLVHHGLKPNATSAGAPPLLPLLGRPTKPRHAEPDLRRRVLGQAARALDRVDSLLTDPDTVDAAVRLLASLAGVVDRLSGGKGKGRGTTAADAPTPTPAEPDTLTPEEEERLDAELDARRAAEGTP